MRIALFDRILRFGICAIVFGAFGWMFTPFLTPILVAALFGFALDRLVSKYALKRAKRRAPTALILLGFFLLIAIPISTVTYRLVSFSQEVAAVGMQSTPLYKTTSALVHSLGEKVDKVLLMVNAKPMEGKYADFLPKAGTAILQYVGSIASSAPEMILNLFVFSAALYFFLTESKYIRLTISSFRILKDRELDQLIAVVQKSSYTTLVVSASIGSLQALIVAIGGLVFGYTEFFLLFVVTFFTSFIPVIGAAPVALFLAILSFAQGEIFSGVGLVVVAMVAGSIDNIVKPLVVAAGTEDMSPIVSLLAIVGAVMVYGIPGLLLGPILLDLVLKVVPILFPSEEKAVSNPKS